MDFISPAVFKEIAKYQEHRDGQEVTVFHIIGFDLNEVFLYFQSAVKKLPATRYALQSTLWQHKQLQAPTHLTNNIN